MKDWLQNITLELNGVQLIPLQKEHKNGLIKAASRNAI